ncbi:MAG TPA: hypothetical protein VER96_12815 [Polyangiaceae bacterium]|nr:hypothetical protein [Polyangiaceae bacterium]
MIRSIFCVVERNITWVVGCVVLAMCGCGSRDDSIRTEYHLPPSEPVCQPHAKDAFARCEPLPDAPQGSTTSGGMFAVDDDNFYYAQGTGAIWVKSRSGVEPDRFIDSARGYGEIAIDATNVYSTGDSLQRVSKLGGPATTLFDGPTTSLVLADGFVYFIAQTFGQSAELWRWSSPKGAERLADLLDEATDQQLLLADGYAYVLLRSSQPGGILRVDTTSHELTQIVSGIDVSRGFAKIGDQIYFSEEGSRSVKRVSADGGEAVTLSTFLGYPQKLYADGARLYVTVLDADPVTHAANANLFRLPIDGSDACLLKCANPYGVPAQTYLFANGNDFFD